METPMTEAAMNMRTLAIVLAAALWPAAAPAQPYAQSGGWQFDNFKDPALPWDIYRDSFIGIPPTRDPWSSAFDVLFYDQVYKSELSKKGNCYGMSLLSLMILKKGGHLGIVCRCRNIQATTWATLARPTPGSSVPSTSCTGTK
jgi:hypothetical protein